MATRTKAKGPWGTILDELKRQDSDIIVEDTGVGAVKITIDDTLIGTFDGSGLTVVGDVIADNIGGATNAISQGDSNVTVTDAGTGVITMTADGDEVLNVGLSDFTVKTQNGIEVESPSGGSRIDIGANDSSEGELNIYNTSGSAAQIQLHVDPDADDTITRYYIRSRYDDLEIGPSTDPNAMLYDGSNQRWIFDNLSGEMELRYNGTAHLQFDNEGLIIGQDADLNIDFDYISALMKIEKNGTNMATFQSGGAVELYHNGTKVFNTRSDGFDFTDGTDIANVQFAGGDVYITNTHHGGKLFLRSEKAAGSSVSFLIGDPDGATEIYHSGTKVFETTTDGVKVTDGTSIAEVKYEADDLVIKNTAHDGDVFIKAENAAGTERILASFNTETQFDFYIAGSSVLTGGSGYIALRPNIIYFGSNGTEGQIISNPGAGSGYVSFETLVHGDNVQLAAEDGSGVRQVLVEGDPDGAVDLYYDGTKVFETIATGVLITDATDNAHIEFASNILRIDNVSSPIIQIHGNDTALCAQFNAAGASQLYYNGAAAFYTTSVGIQAKNQGTGDTLDINAGVAAAIKSSNNGGTIQIEGDDTATGAQSIMFKGDPDGAAELYHAGTKVVNTTADGMVNPVNNIAITGKTGWDRADWSTLQISFSYPTFTLGDSGGSHEFWVEGTKYSKTGDQTCTITDTEGQWYFFYDNTGTLSCSQTPWDLDEEDKCLVANGYWDAVNNSMILLGFECHTFHMPAATHYHMHEVIGCLYEEGLVVTDNADGTIDISAGEIHDEDINIKITDDAGSGFWDQTLTPAELPIYSRSGASGLWRREYNSTATYFVAQDVSDNPYWNNPAGPWTQVASTNNQYSAWWIIATNNMDEPVICVMGQGAPSNIELTAINNNDINDLDLSLFPAAEFKILYRVMVQNAGAPYTVSTITDFRTAQSVGGTSAVVNSHGALNGLSADDHPQYLLTDGTRTLTGGVQFPATQVASADANNLDDYEEGTWTPVPADAATAGNTGSATTALGTYQKVGNTVTVHFLLTDVDTTGLTAGNVFHIQGLPFTVQNTVAIPYYGSLFVGNITFAGNYLQSNVTNNQTAVRLAHFTSAGAAGLLNVSALTSTQADIRGTITYEV